MILTIDKLREIAQGAEDVVKSDKGTEFVRFNKKEQEFYLTSTLESRTHSPAGIQLCFRTDGNKINIAVETENCLDRSFFCLDVLCDGVWAGCLKNFEDDQMTGFYSWSKYPLGDYEGSFDLGEGEKEIRIVLPWSVRTYIKKIEIENASFIEAVKKEKMILMYGDSITHSYDCAHSMNSYSVRLAHKLDAELCLKAVGGERFTPALAEIKQDKNPDYVTIAYGTNDWSYGKKELFDENSQSFIEKVCNNYKNSKVFVITPIWRKDSVRNEPLGNEFDDIHYVERKLSEICESIDNAVCIRGWDLVPHDENLYGDLRLHPNDKGFEYYAENLYDEITKSL